MFERFPKRLWQALNEQLEKLEEDFRADTESLAERYDPDTAKPWRLCHCVLFKQNIQVRVMTLAWLPCQSGCRRDRDPCVGIVV